MPLMASKDFWCKFDFPDLCSSRKQGRLTRRVTDEGALVVIWGCAEGSVTIMATSMPMLRVLICTFTGSRRLSGSQLPGNILPPPTIGSGGKGNPNLHDSAAGSLDKIDAIVSPSITHPSDVERQVEDVSITTIEPVKR
jgi:hypothetical protein